MDRHEQNTRGQNSAEKNETMGAHAVWNSVRGRLKTVIGEEAVSKWIEDLRLIAEVDDRILLAARNRFVFDRVNRDYKRAVSSAWTDADPKGRRLRFECWTQAPKAIRDLAGDPWKETKQESSKAENASASTVRAAVGPSSMSFDTLVVGASNATAVTAVRRILDGAAPAPILYVSGRQGVGKTHLMQALLNALSAAQDPRRVTYMQAEEFMSAYVDGAKKRDTQSLKDKLRQNDILIVDDLQSIAGKEGTDREFFANIRSVVSNGGQVILTADEAPGNLAGLSERLHSELMGAADLQIDLPDDGMREAILRQHAAMFEAADPMFKLDDSAIASILARVRGPGRDLCGVLYSLHAETGFGEIAVTPEMIDRVIRRKEGDVKPPSIDLVKRAVMAVFDVTKSDLESASKARAYVYPRQIAMYLCRVLTQKSFPQIAKCFGDRDHTTIMYGYRKVKKLVEADKDADILAHIQRVSDTVYEMQLNASR